MKSNYDKVPYIAISPRQDDCFLGWKAIVEKIHACTDQGATRICIECYPGIFEDEVTTALTGVFPETSIFHSQTCLKSPENIKNLLAEELTDDRVFGRISRFELKDLFDEGFLNQLKSKIFEQDFAIVIGTGAILALPHPDVLIYADLGRWNIQARQRQSAIGNLGANNESATAAEKYKRGFFVDWRLADRLKQQLLPTFDFLLDTNKPGEPKMISGTLFHESLAQVVKQPFRVVPFFDPGPWGGQWMRKVCDLPADAPNYAWCFDCVPEENSILLGFGDSRVEIPAVDVVFSHPAELLGEAVHARFGAEFPIRFDFLDTVDGGNLSLQVHPLTEYIQRHFGMSYTQDESYYLLDAEATACVYLGLREEVDRQSMVEALGKAQTGGAAFPAEQYVNQWPAKKHDHFLIPAGTIHCSGSGSMVLEISATPYIFTFKLWDWGRLGLDGRPRPIHLEHGIENIQWNRTTAWVRHELINCLQPLGEGDGWREERTGLHEREFIETRRHWFTEIVPYHTNGGVNVINLVEGEEAIVESPSGSFEPFVVHYAETFIVPACVGPYTIRPAKQSAKPLATLKAFVRTSA